ncbi:HTH-type transcriptional regulator BhcR [Rhodovulum sp. YEN HP10]|uniref:HTH-type transcriptional regulator BhcR n=1 Tax=Rhodovulum sp. HP10 TaxID=3387397 RepID=UPI0039E0916B
MTQSRPRGRPRAFHDKTGQNTVRALDRAMGLLTALSETRGLTLSELAALGNQSPATVYRVLITLQGHDIVELEEEAQRWHVGPGAFRIGSGFLRRTNVAERSRGAMQALMRATGETANLGVEDRDEVLFLTQVETHETIRAFFSPGTRGPMHCSGIGKALLSFLPAARVAAILKTQGLPGFTPHSITSETVLHADLERTRSRGYAIDDQERAEGMRCIAAPIFNAHGEPVAGLSVSGPAFRIPLDAADGIGAEVRAAADRVTAATGGIAPTEKSA